MTMTAATRAAAEHLRTRGHTAPVPWGREAESLLAAAELAEAAARTHAAGAVSQDAGRHEVARTRALATLAGTLTLALLRRKALGEATPCALERAAATLSRVRAAGITDAEVAAAEQRRVERLSRLRDAAEAEMESAGTAAGMVERMAVALAAESSRAEGHARRLGTNIARPHVVAAEGLWARAHQAAEEWRARVDSGAAVTKGEWKAAVDRLVTLRADLADFERRLRAER